MSTEPTIGAFIDDEERELIESMEAAINKDDYVPVSVMTPEMLVRHQQAARNTLNQERQRISLRVPRNDLTRLKAKAMREGIPYQTAINSLIHKYVSQ